MNPAPLFGDASPQRIFEIMAAPDADNFLAISRLVLARSESAWAAGINEHKANCEALCAAGINADILLPVFDVLILVAMHGTQREERLNTLRREFDLPGSNFTVKVKAPQTEAERWKEWRENYGKPNGG